MQNRRKSSKPNMSDSQLASHVELEAKRVKQVTEAILYELLPAVLSAAIEDANTELSWEKCQVGIGQAAVPKCAL